MGKRSKIILGLLIAVLIGIIATEIVRPKPINWRPSFTSSSKIPFGCYVLYQELPTLFPDSKIETVEESIYNVLTTRDSSKISTYIAINNMLSFDTQESKQLLNYVAKGNQVFIAANNLYGMLADTLNIEMERYYDFKEDTASVSLTNTRFKTAQFRFERGADPVYFTSVDTLNTEILGHISFTEKSFLPTEMDTLKSKPNFIKTAFGNGHFYINTLPAGFSNYYLLNRSSNYSAQSLSYLTNDYLYWDDYKKSGRKIITSPMRFVLNQPALKWAYYLTIFALLLFVIFKAKREQRIIPIVSPLENSSVEFARTVGTLYHQNKDYTNLNHQKINYFLSFIRNRYFVNTAILDDAFIRTLANKSGNSINDTKTLVTLILNLKNKPIHTEQDTVTLSKKINAFKKSYGR
ncbi:protein of unknown function [Maribacter sedimenticola]|uniref:DUF4350 domain-containing protein n=1 Tax=Maribacter sedimenticola TaxID=228956 RepID=A0ABY1SM01_9FLAO|nr:DUF4350 domain-containing protein [Maribacter sedimenticola]SNR77440.1 protein of unknown function [Maribacter sedimenticola]